MCFTCSTLVICHVYLVNVPSGRASFRTNPVVKFGSRFFLLPDEIRCCRQSENTCGAWNTKGSGFPEINMKKKSNIFLTNGGISYFGKRYAVVDCLKYLDFTVR